MNIPADAVEAAARAARDIAVSDARERLVYAYIGQDQEAIAAAKLALAQAQDMG